MRSRALSLAVVAGFLSVGSFGLAAIAYADPPDAITICHAAGLEGTTQYVTLTLAPQAVYGPAGHFNEDGTPQAGHEQDYFGLCAEPTPSPTPEPSPSETPTPSDTPSPTPTDTGSPGPSPSETPSPSDTPTTTPTPSDSPTPSETPTPTETPTPSQTPTPSETPSSSPSETPSPTSSPSSTPSETPSATTAPPTHHHGGNGPGGKTVAPPRLAFTGTPARAAGFLAAGFLFAGISVFAIAALVDRRKNVPELGRVTANDRKRHDIARPVAVAHLRRVIRKRDH